MTNVHDRAPHPTTAEKTIDRLLALTEQLEAIIVQENTLLEERRPRDLVRFRNEKAQLSEAYQAELAALREAPEILAGGSPEEIARLKATTFRFHKLLNENFRRVAAAKGVTERLFKTIGDHVMAKQNPVQGYTKNATMAVPGKRSAGNMASIAINQVV
jgi:hypothetical protein